MVFRHGLGQEHDAALARAVGGGSFTAGQAPVRRDIDDAALRMQQVRQRRAAEKERNVEVDRHRIAPVIVTGLGHVGPHDNAGIIDEAVELTEFVDCVGYELVTVL